MGWIFGLGPYGEVMSFWKEGLNFTCKQCGRCCCGEPGIVYFNPTEFNALVEHLKETRGLTREDIIRDYMWPYRDSYTARDDFDDGRCIFFEKGKGCTVYEFRPSQCRDFPFWRCNLESQDEWDDVGRTCPGVNQGKHWTAEEIKKIASKARL